MSPLESAILSFTMSLFGASGTPDLPAHPISGPHMVFQRQTGFIGDLCLTRVSVDGRVLLDLKANHKVSIDAPPGRRLVELESVATDDHPEGWQCPNWKASRLVDVGADRSITIDVQSQ